MDLNDLFEEGSIGDNARFNAQESERRHGPEDDDIETVAPFIGMCPDESDSEEASPLDFGKPSNAFVGRSYTYLRWCSINRC
jgi:hypothetical protein